MHKPSVVMIITFLYSTHNILWLVLSWINQVISHTKPFGTIYFFAIIAPCAILFSTQHSQEIIQQYKKLWYRSHFWNVSKSNFLCTNSPILWIKGDFCKNPARKTQKRHNSAKFLNEQDSKIKNPGPNLLILNRVLKDYFSDFLWLNDTKRQPCVSNGQIKKC